jgi:hypothetical protein
MPAELRVEVLDGIAQRDARHRGCVPVEVCEQASGIALARFADPPADRLLHEILRVVGEEVADGERVIEVVVPNEEVCRYDRRTPFPPLGGSGEVIQRFARLVGEIPPDYVWSSAVDQVPGVDQVVTPYIELVQLPTTRLRCAAPAGLEVHDTDCSDSRLVIGDPKQGIDLGGRHPGEFLGQGENEPHRQSIPCGSEIAKPPSEVCGQELVIWSHRFT